MGHRYGPEYKKSTPSTRPRLRKGTTPIFFSWLYGFNGDEAGHFRRFPGKPGYVYENPGSPGSTNLAENQ
jgi:hypothetical protein